MVASGCVALLEDINNSPEFEDPLNCIVYKGNCFHVHWTRSKVGNKRVPPVEDKLGDITCVETLTIKHSKLFAVASTIASLLCFCTCAVVMPFMQQHDMTLAKTKTRYFERVQYSSYSW